MAATSAQVYVELDAESHDDLSGITTDLTNVISSGKLSVGTLYFLAAL